MDELSELKSSLDMLIARLKTGEIDQYRSAARLEDAIDQYEAFSWPDPSDQFHTVLNAFADVLSEAVGGIT